MPTRIRHQRFKLNLTPEEEKWVIALATDAKLAPAAWCRKVIVGVLHKQANLRSLKVG